MSDEYTLPSFSYFVCEKSIRQRQVVILKELLHILKEKKYEDYIHQYAAAAFIVCHGLSKTYSTTHCVEVPSVMHDSKLFVFPWCPQWNHFFSVYAKEFNTCSGNLECIFDQDVRAECLEFITIMAIEATSYISSDHCNIKYVSETFNNNMQLDTIQCGTAHNIQIVCDSNSGSSHDIQLFADNSNAPLKLYPLCSQIPQLCHLLKFHIALLLASSIAGTLAASNSRISLSHGIREHYSSFTLSYWLFHSGSILREKLKCVAQYFLALQRVFKVHTSLYQFSQTRKMREIITVTRIVGDFLKEFQEDKFDSNYTKSSNRCMSSSAIHTNLFSCDTYFEEWKKLQIPLVKVQLTEDGSIQDCDDCIQADFANKFIGGGVLRNGAVQEEILFCTFPELLPLLLFIPELRYNEAILVQGVERFVEHSGYSHTFRCDGLVCKSNTAVISHGNRFSMVPLDSTQLRRKTAIVLMDASNYSGLPLHYQYSTLCVARELLKCYTAMTIEPWLCNTSAESNAKFATGNWSVSLHVNHIEKGCGVFQGDPQLKFVIQWLAASRAKRELVYCSFKDRRVLGLLEFVNIMRNKYKTIGNLIKMLFLYMNRDVPVNGLWHAMKTVTEHQSQ